MSLKKIGSRDSTAFELSSTSSKYSKVSGDLYVSWVEPTTSSLRFSPGRYRIDRTEPGKVEVFSISPWSKAGTYDASLFYLETDKSGSAVYFGGGGTVFITRLA